MFSWFRRDVSIRCTNPQLQEGYLAKYAVSDEDRMAANQGQEHEDGPADPMQGLEGLDVAGPKLA